MAPTHLADDLQFLHHGTAPGRLRLPLLPLPSGFHGSPLGLLRSSSALPVVRFHGSSPDLLSTWVCLCQGSIDLPRSRYVFLYSSYRQSSTDISPGSSWVFLYSACRQGSTDLPRISLGVPVLFLPSGFHGSPPGFPWVCLCFPCRRVPRVSIRFGSVSFSCHDGARDLPQVCSSLPQLLWTSGIHMTLPQVSSALPVSSVSLSLRSPCVSVYLLL